jgi:YD repeat-containing protein
MSTIPDYSQQITTLVYSASPRREPFIPLGYAPRGWERLTFSDAGLQVRAVDAKGMTITWSFERRPSAGAPHARVEHARTDDAASTDAAGPAVEGPWRLSALVREPGGKHLYAYDSAAGTIRVRDPEGHETLFSDEPGTRLVPEIDEQTGAVRHVFRPLGERGAHEV